MAQNITLMGASYTDVPGVQLPKTGGGTALFSDASITTATASDVAQGKLFLAASGAITTGTNSGGGGGSPYTLVTSKEYNVNVTSTSVTALDTIETGLTPWPLDKLVYVKIRKKTTPATNTYAGSDAFFWAGSSSLSAASGAKVTVKRGSSGANNIAIGTGVAGYGIYPQSFSSDGKINLCTRYNSTNSGQINGVYVVEIYTLDYPNGDSPF